MLAAGASDREFAARLRKARADINVKDTDGRTALMLAAGEGHTACVQLLTDAAIKGKKQSTKPTITTLALH